jgi:hypothetical protein
MPCVPKVTDVQLAPLLTDLEIPVWVLITIKEPSEFISLTKKLFCSFCSSSSMARENDAPKSLDK